MHKVGHQLGGTLQAIREGGERSCIETDLLCIVDVLCPMEGHLQSPLWIWEHRLDCYALSVAQLLLASLGGHRRHHQLPPHFKYVFVPLR